MFADFHARLACLAESERALDEVALSGFHGGCEFILLAQELGHVELIQLGLRVECVDVAGTATHEQKDAGFGARSMMRGLRTEHTGAGLVLAQKRGERHAAESRA